ncbi:unnamed protein product [Cercospora beticola]|nr:unnamed protein product [Cercospora beticola]
MSDRRGTPTSSSTTGSRIHHAPLLHPAPMCVIAVGSINAGLPTPAVSPQARRDYRGISDIPAEQSRLHLTSHLVLLESTAAATLSLAAMPPGLEHRIFALLRAACRLECFAASRYNESPHLASNELVTSEGMKTRSHKLKGVLNRLCWN